MAKRGLLNRALEEIQERTGVTTVSTERLALLEQWADDYGATVRQLDDLGWTALNYVAGRPQEPKATRRRADAQKSRYGWMTDPMAGAAINLLNDFVFGRGVPKPRAKDDDVQEIIDEAWDDPDNQRVLTGFQAQMELGTDLSIQSNIFLLYFGDGDDGKVKLGLLNHDTVEDAVTDPDNRLRVLWYYTQERRVEWDFATHQYKPELQGEPKKLYYAHWQNLQQAEEEEGRDNPVPQPKPDEIGDGLVYHLAVNKGMEQVFGVPEFRRTMRWFGAYNEFMQSRVDMTKAAAAFIMQRTAKGSPSQLSKLATKAINRGSELSATVGGQIPEGVSAPPPPASIADMNDAVKLEPLKLDSGAGNASQDALMLRAQVSAGTHFPQHYLGDAGSANLATATSMELPVLKHVEARQEVMEQLFRWFLDRVIERAVDSGRLPATKTVERSVEDIESEPGLPDVRSETTATQNGRGRDLSQGYEDQGDDEESTERDLSYEFSMPSPLRRMMGDLVTACQLIAQTFDPNNTNVELSRVLLNIALGEALEVQDPQDIVERVFPKGYVDPAIAAAQAAAAQQQGGGPGGEEPNPFSPDATDTPADPGNPYGAPAASAPPEQRRAGAYASQEGYVTTQGRHGEPVVWRVVGPGTLEEVAQDQLPDTIRAQANGRKVTAERLWRDDVESVVHEQLARLVPGQTNGHDK